MSKTIKAGLRKDIPDEIAKRATIENNPYSVTAFKEIDELRQTVNRIESKCNILSSQTGTMSRIIEKLYEEIETLKKQIGGKKC